MNFIQNEKLKWPSPIVAKGKAFEYEEDICVQFNDWPYGIEKEVVHLVVWTKFPLEEAGNAGDLSDAERRRIDKFVDQRFRKPLGAENVSNDEAKSFTLLTRNRSFGFAIGLHSRVFTALSTSTSCFATRVRNF